MAYIGLVFCVIERKTALTAMFVSSIFLILISFELVLNISSYTQGLRAIPLNHVTLGIELTRIKLSHEENSCRKAFDIFPSWFA